MGSFAFFPRIAPWFRPYRGQCLTALAALFAVHLVEAAIPLYLRDGIDAIARADAGIPGPVLAILGLTVLRFLLLNFGRRRNALVAVALAADLRQALYEHLLRLGRGFHGRHRLGDLLARATNDIAAIRHFFRIAVHQLTSLVSVALVAPVFMALQSAALTVLLLPLLAAMAAAGWVLAERIRLASEAAQAGYGTLTETLQQNLKGIRTILSHGQEEREIRHLAGAAQRHAAADPGRDRAPRRLLRLPGGRRRPGPGWHLPDGAPGRDRRRHRTHRLRQVHLAEPAGPPTGTERGPHFPRRARPAAHPARPTAAKRGAGAAGHLPVRGLVSGEHFLRRSGASAGADSHRRDRSWKADHPGHGACVADT